MGAVVGQRDASHVSAQNYQQDYPQFHLQHLSPALTPPPPRLHVLATPAPPMRNRAHLDGGLALQLLPFRLLLLPLGRLKLGPFPCSNLLRDREALAAGLCLRWAVVAAAALLHLSETLARGFRRGGRLGPLGLLGLLCCFGRRRHRLLLGLERSGRRLSARLLVGR